jgi:hypothetical protein
VTCGGGLIATAGLLSASSTCTRVGWGSGAGLEVRALPRSLLRLLVSDVRAGRGFGTGVPAAARVPYDELVQERISVDDRCLVVALPAYLRYLACLGQVAKGALFRFRSAPPFTVGGN